MSALSALEDDEGMGVGGKSSSLGFLEEVEVEGGGGWLRKRVAIGQECIEHSEGGLVELPGGGRFPLSQPQA